MKINLLVIGYERLFFFDKILVLKIDIKGIIMFVNKDFVEIFGFVENELVDVNYNIICYLDMLLVVFEVMWKILKCGVFWYGVVKNCCKNGDYYWVDVKVVLIKKSGWIIGYMLVCICLLWQDVVVVEVVYWFVVMVLQIIQEMVDVDWKKYLLIKNGIFLWIFFVMLMMIVGGIFGIMGFSFFNLVIELLYYEEMKLVQVIGCIYLFMGDNWVQFVLVLYYNFVV